MLNNEQKPKPLSISSALNAYSLNNDNEIVTAFYEFIDAGNPREAVIEGFKLYGIDILSIINPKKEDEDLQKESIEKFHMGMRSCYNDIIYFLDRWVDIPQEYKKIIALWIIGTYFHKNFNTFPYLYLNAMRGSGKTRLLRIISWLQYNGNGEVLTNPSDSVLFRTAKERGLILDEMETERSKEKQTMREYLNVCYKQGGIVYRMEKQKVEGKEAFVAVGHKMFTPVAIANIEGIDDVLQDRSITIILEKSMSPGYVKMIEDFPDNFIIKDIKRRLNELCVQCVVYSTLQKGIYSLKWNSFITKKYESVHSIHTINNTTNYTQLYTTDYTESEREMFEKIDKTNIFGRNLELFMPLLIITQMVNVDMFDEILDIVNRLDLNKKEEDFAESRDISLIEFISLANRYRLEYVRSSDLFREFKEFIGNQGDDQESKWLNITWFGNALKRLKLINHKKREAKGQVMMLNIDYAKEKLKVFKSEEKQ